MQTDDVIEETIVTTQTRRKRKPPTREAQANAPTHVCLLIDESASMRAAREKTIDSINDYLMTLKKKGANKFRVTLATFNSLGTRVRYADVPLETTAIFTAADYTPNYDTPLYDAMGDTLHTMERSVRNDGGVVFVLITDGAENASRRFSPQQIYAMREEKEKAGWTFVYLGADMTELQARSQSQFLGFTQSNTMVFDKADTGELYKGLAESTANYSNASASMRSASTQNFVGTVGTQTLRKTVKR